MEKAIVATVHVPDASTLVAQIDTLTFGERTYYLLQRPDSISDWTAGCPDTAEIEKYPLGRMFGENGELRWQKTDTGYALLWLSEGELPTGFAPLGTWEMTKSPDQLLLGGGETEPWRDTRIPRKLAYPMAWSQSPKVQVIQYRDSDSQIIRFTRYTGFIQGG